MNANHNEILKNAEHENEKTNNGKKEEVRKINLQKSNDAKEHAVKLVEDFLTNPSIQEYMLNFHQISSKTSVIYLVIFKKKC